MSLDGGLEKQVVDWKDSFLGHMLKNYNSFLSLMLIFKLFIEIKLQILNN